MALLFCQRQPVRWLHKQSMIFRLSETDQSTFLEMEGAAEFEPMPGRKMKGYVIS